MRLVGSTGWLRAASLQTRWLGEKRLGALHSWGLKQSVQVTAVYSSMRHQKQ
jgi:hypothetical protein